MSAPTRVMGVALRTYGNKITRTGVILQTTAALMQRRRGFHAGRLLRMAEVIMNVPSMGDSITEGTIKSWNKQVGDAVKPDEVVAVIETDKVSVDIRAKEAGVLAEQYAAVDETVEVGAKLLKLDTSAKGGEVASKASAPAPAAAPSPSPSPAPAPSPKPASQTTQQEQHTKSHAHKPLIKFLGKRSLLKEHPEPTAPAPAPAPAPAKAEKPASLSVGTTRPHEPVRYEDLKTTPGARSFTDLPPLYGRPRFSDEEIVAIESGGATS